VSQLVTDKGAREQPSTEEIVELARNYINLEGEEYHLVKELKDLLPLLEHYRGRTYGKWGRKQQQND
jgi:hypothetical protein